MQQGFGCGELLAEVPLLVVQIRFHGNHGGFISSLRYVSGLWRVLAME
jgi:hypothetical protein